MKEYLRLAEERFIGVLFAEKKNTSTIIWAVVLALVQEIRHDSQGYRRSSENSEKVAEIGRDEKEGRSCKGS